MKLLSERLNWALFEHAQKTQADLARACDVKPSSVSDWLSGETKVMKAASLIRAAAFLNVSALWLLEGTLPRVLPVGGPAATAGGPYLVAESPPAYGTKWPLTGISEEEFFQLLTPDDRRDIETFALGILAGARRRGDRKHGS